MNKTLVSVLMCLLFVSPASLLADDHGKKSAMDTIKSLESKVDILETQVADLELLQSQGNPVTTFDSIRLDFGGFITQQFTGIVNSENDEGSFDQTNVELLIGADVTEKDSFFAALGFLRRSFITMENTAEDVTMREWEDRRNQTPLIIGWYKHEFNDQLDVTLGRFINPWGIINIEHFPPTLMNLSQPQFLRPFGGATIIPNFIDGAQAHGTTYFGDSEFEYYAYIAEFANNAGELLFGGRAAITDPSRVVTVGGNYQHGNRDDDTYDAFGLDVLVDYEGFGLKTEYIVNTRDDLGDQETFYVQPFYRVGDWLAFYRYDVIDLDDDVDSDASEQEEHILGVNYFYTPTIRLRGEYAFNIYDLENDSLGQDRDFDTVQVSITVSF